MKRIFVLLICLLITFCFVGCTEKPKNTESTTSIVIIPDSKTKATVNGYKQFSNSVPETKEETKTSDEFYANKSTKKFHTSSCSFALKIKEENLYKSSNRNELISGGYEGCKKCNP